MLPAGLLERELRGVAEASAFCVACCLTKDVPLVYASDAFCTLTGYDRKEVVGRNCRFLQGRQTTRRSVADIRNALTEERRVTVMIINYDKTQTAFWNQLQLSPVKDRLQKLRYYVGVCRHSGVPDGAGPWKQSDTAVAEEQLQEAGAICAVFQRLLEEHAPTFVDSSVGAAKYDLPASLLAPLMRLRHPFVLTDPSCPDGPVVHASPLFLRLCGYPRDFVLGRNCRFMQGPHTDRAKVKEMRRALDDTNLRPFTVQLLNYRGDGTPFWNHLHIAPIRNHQGGLAHFVGIQLDVTDAPASGKDGKVLQSMSSPETPAGVAEAGQSHMGSLSEPVLPREVPNSERRAQQSVVGAVRVACRSLGGPGSGGGLRRPVTFQRRASMDMPLRRVSFDVDELHNRRSSDGPTYQAQPRVQIRH